jgi:hypothetical protein
MSAFVVAGEAVSELTGDRSSLGYASIPADRRWTDLRVEKASTATFYLASDGVLDMPGGERGFGFGRARLAAAIGAVAGFPLREQGERLSAAFDGYRGPLAHKDDLTFIGFRIMRGGKE